MNDNQACVEVDAPRGLLLGGSNKELTLTRHRQLSELAYSTKKFIDANGGVTSSESCRFGQMMSELINLK